MTRIALAPEIRAVGIKEHPLVVAEGDAFRGAMRSLASGVSLVTHGHGSELNGLTATSVSSLSTDPPSLVVCLNRNASLYLHLSRGARFGVSVLGADQQEIADRFAGRHGAKGRDRFQSGRWSLPEDGPPLLLDGVAAFSCEIEEIIERHSHAIVIGRVRGVISRDDGMALVYWRGAYDRLGWSEEEVARAIGVTPNRCATNAAG